MDFPGIPVFDGSLTVISTFSWAATGDVGICLAGTYASTAPASANGATFIPFRVQETVLVKKMGWRNGAGVAGNADMGIYDIANARRISTGSVAQAGASSWQITDIADTTLSPGYYWMAFVASTVTTATYWASAPGAQLLRTLGCYGQASALPLPATSTPAQPPPNYLPWIALFLNSVV